VHCQAEHRAHKRNQLIYYHGTVYLNRPFITKMIDESVNKNQTHTILSHLRIASRMACSTKDNICPPQFMNHPVAEELSRIYHTGNAHQYEPTPSSLGIVLFNRPEVEDEGYDTSDSSNPPSRMIKTPTWTSAVSCEDYTMIDPLVDYEGREAEQEPPACDSSECSMDEGKTIESWKGLIPTPIYDEMTSISKIQEFRLPEFKNLPRIEPQMQFSSFERRGSIPFEDDDESPGATSSISEWMER
jgi:hypothetical protein